jgi:ubiquinone/menaquinone biosynthesis C-methylase UbiE
MFKKFLARPNYFPFRRLFWKVWYNRFASDYTEVDIACMNYGFAELDSLEKPLILDAADEEERYCFQLYHHVASAISLEGLDVLEVGCGRGGGSNYIRHSFNPKSMTGVDYAESNIELCKKKFPSEQLNFCVGDAESLSFDRDSFDAVVNVESSHCYGNEEIFFAEVFRVLRPGGYFLFTDFRPQEAINLTKERLKNAGFEMIKEEIITANVLQSMNLEEERKIKTIHDKNPRYIHKISKWFVAVQGTPIYEAFKNREQEYFCYCLQKPLAQPGS